MLNHDGALQRTRSAGSLNPGVTDRCASMIKFFTESLSRQWRKPSCRVGATHRMPRAGAGGLHPPYDRKPGSRNRLSAEWMLAAVRSPADRYLSGRNRTVFGLRLENDTRESLTLLAPR
jgi:hypothetical protein